MSTKRVEKIINLLLNHYSSSWRPASTDPFKSLVRIVLSQNTNYKNQAMAYVMLEEKIGVTPQKIINSSLKDITEAIKPAGMYNQRSKRLKKIAKEVLLRFKGDLSTVLDKPYKEAREILVSLPGVGPKTADVLLMFNGGKKVIPVDRHIHRITRRLEIVPEKANYDTIRKTLEAASPLDRHEDVHLFLIRLGREICKAQNPRCNKCFLFELCPFYKRTPRKKSYHES